MARPPRPEADAEFVARLSECEERCGSRAALARRAGLTPSTVQNYFEGGEPSRRALVDLARAAGIAVEWLATGEGNKEPSAAPPEYSNIVSFDLSATGAHLRGILDKFGEHPRKPKGRLIKRSDLYGSAASLESYFVENSGLAFEPIVGLGDVFIFSVPHGHEVARLSNIAGWDFIEPDRIFLVAAGLELKLRALRRAGETVQVLLPGETIEATLSGYPRDFLVFGYLIWRGGRLAPIRNSKESRPDSKRRAT